MGELTKAKINQKQAVGICRAGRAHEEVLRLDVAVHEPARTGHGCDEPSASTGREYRAMASCSFLHTKRISRARIDSLTTAASTPAITRKSAACDMMPGRRALHMTAEGLRRLDGRQGLTRTLSSAAVPGWSAPRRRCRRRGSPACAGPPGSSDPTGWAPEDPSPEHTRSGCPN